MRAQAVMVPIVNPKRYELRMRSGINCVIRHRNIEQASTYSCWAEEVHILYDDAQFFRNAAKIPSMPGPVPGRTDFSLHT